MRIYLVRHGESLSAEADDERPLSEKGQKDIQKLATFLASITLHAHHLFHSHKLRAQQTANILATMVREDFQISLHNGLRPLSPLGPIINDILAWGEDTIWVGHMPFLGKLVGQLVAHNEDNMVVGFQPGTIACLEQINKDQWILCWVLSPELL